MSSVLPSADVQRRVAAEFSRVLSEFSDEIAVPMLISAAWGIARKRGMSAADFAQFVADQTKLLERGTNQARDRIVELVTPEQYAKILQMPRGGNLLKRG